MANLRADLAITSLDAMTAYGITSNEFLFQLDELQNVTIDNAEEKVDITGKQGRKLNSLKRNKTVTISGTNGTLNGGLMEMQTGSEFVTKDNAKVRWVDQLEVTTNSATTTWKAVGTTGNEIIALYVKNENGTLGTKLEQDASAAEGKFAYAPATKALTFAANELADGTEIVVFYERALQADVLENQSDTYSTKCKLYIDATAEDGCANQYHVQIFIPKADFDGNFSLEMGDNQTVQNFNAESLAGACGASGSLWTYTVFGANEADAE